MKITAHAEGTPQEIATQLRAVANNFDSMSSESATPARAGKKAAKVEEEIDEELLESEIEIPVDDSTEETEESDDAPTKKDVLAALKKFASRGETYAEKAKATLKKFKVKHIDDLPAKSYSDVIKALK